jgi:hypothetical protein
MSSRGGFTVGISSEARMAQYVKDHVEGKNAILTDNANTFGVILLSGRPQVFLDRIDKGDARWNDVLTRPNGVVQYLLLNRNTQSGDRITERYPNADNGTESGLTPVFRTKRYLLVKVAATRVRRGTAATTTSGTTSTTGATPPAFCTCAMAWSVSVVLPLDSGP